MYLSLIESILNETAQIEHYNPRHVMAFMVLTHGTLNHLSRSSFGSEVEEAIIALNEEGDEVGEELAQSYGI
jgi:hypothetical protein